MRGVVIKKASVIAEDERRKIVSILNGELIVRDIHILFMKSGEKEDNRFKCGCICGFNNNVKFCPYHGVKLYNGQRHVSKPLGNHKHWYPEVMYVIKGKCHYWLKNKEGEEMECDMEEGDIMFRAPEVVHTCTCSEDAILLDGASESWIDEDWNHVREVLKE